MPDSPKDANKLISQTAVFMVGDEVQLAPNDVAVTRRFANH
jgi:hypothetical protein